MRESNLHIYSSLHTWRRDWEKNRSRIRRRERWFSGGFWPFLITLQWDAFLYPETRCQPPMFFVFRTTFTSWWRVTATLVSCAPMLTRTSCWLERRLVLISNLSGGSIGPSESVAFIIDTFCSVWNKSAYCLHFQQFSDFISQILQGFCSESDSEWIQYIICITQKIMCRLKIVPKV